ncbi:MAG TPA: hypothetical protein VMV81_03900, partial [Phycisphaerae bacterium]|nr:hypothetical protein [Phycisphaerae bacterium]
MDTPRPNLPPIPQRKAPSSGRWYLRIPAKIFILLAVIFVVCFPYPRQFARHLHRIRNMQEMIEPDAPELRPWVDELSARIAKAPQTQPSAQISAERISQHEVERFVYEHVKYEWDWNLWGSADYMPTVHEMFEKAKEFGGQVKEDCDGRAVMAASLMKSLGYQPRIVTDFRHVWVTTPEGEWMGPGGPKSMVSTSQGTQVNWASAGSNFAISLSYGIAVFPFFRELIILAAIFILSLRRWSRFWPAAIGLILLFQGLLFMRLGFFAPQAIQREVSSWPTW